MLINRELTNQSGYSYKEWLITSGIGNCNGNMETYKAWLKNVDPKTYKPIDS